MRFWILFILAGVTTATAQAPTTAEFKPESVANLKQIMKSILLPTSDAIFAAASELPKDDDGWEALENAAMAIAEAPTLIMMPGRKLANGKNVPVNNPDWPKWSVGLREAGQAAYKAIKSRNEDAIVDVGDVLAEACANCHDIYRDPPDAISK